MTNFLELLYLIAFIGVLAVAYSYLLSGQIISSSAGNSRMQEIAEAIQIGAKAYLNRQYKTIAIVGVIVLAIVTYFFSYLVGIGYFFGAFLSGGIDSAAVVATMQSFSSVPINTFTIGFEEKDYSEHNQASAIAKYLGNTI